jgi:uncharacterized protein YfaS (alpha-2-macroglobulin family)
MPVMNRILRDENGRRPPRISRNCTVSTKLTKTEFAEIERLAEEHGQWLSEWVRDVLLEAIEEQKTPRYHVAFIELQALRLLLVNTLEPLLRGDKMTAEQFKEMLRYVKANKRKAAEDMLASYAERSTEQL